MDRGTFGCRLITSGESDPAWPFLLAADAKQTLPLEAVPADADAIADRSAILLDEVQVSVHRIDNDRARRLVRAEENDLPLQRRRQLLIARVRHDTGLFSDCKLLIL